MRVQHFEELDFEHHMHLTLAIAGVYQRDKPKTLKPLNPANMRLETCFLSIKTLTDLFFSSYLSAVKKALRTPQQVNEQTWVGPKPL